MITKAQKEKLLLAISKAKRYHSCRYTDAGEPCCVIGQLSFLEGIPIAIIETWEKQTIPAILQYKLKSEEPLRSYPKDLLTDIQNQWDHGQQVTEEGARNNMIALVEKEEMHP